jgi:endoglucanase
MVIAAIAMAGASLAVPSVIPASAVTTGFTVSGNHLYFNGEAFLGQGFTLIGVVDPKWCHYAPGEAAARHLKAKEMKAAKEWQANLIRYQVSQPGLSNPDLSVQQIAGYVSRIKSAVALARGKGFGVILSMQDEKPACGGSEPLPSTATVTAWSHLAPVFAGDPDVMFELYNEPQNGTTAKDWQQWKSGGCEPIAFCSVGHQQLIDDIRVWAPNVVLVDGAQQARSLASVPLLHDTATGRGIVYAVHPYGVHSAAYEEPRFGYLAPKVPVLVTEWNYKGCQYDPRPELNWFRSIGVGLTGWAFDVPGSLITGWNYQPTSCSNSTTWVGGAAVKADFAS